ncbi:MAG: hypothetical protein HY047_11450 [Acidobacteria bacterium]|nr:hypothetical protein [Acidobacteriota bacterium]
MRRRAAWFAFATVAAVVLYRLRAFLPPETLPARGDPSLPFQGSDLTPRHVPDLIAAIRALWQDGAVGFWNPLAAGGVPLFEAPESGVLSLATLLGGVVRYEAAVKWAALAHVLAGMAGVFVFARTLRVSSPFAALGALVFALGTFLLDHFRVGHLGFINPMTLLPWSFYLLHRALTASRRMMWWAVASGAVAGVSIFEGGTNPAYYGVFALGSPVFAAPFDAGGRASFLRALGASAMAILTLAGVAAPQLIPMILYMPLTGRGAGLRFDESWSGISEVAHPIPEVAWLALCALGIVALWVSDQRRVAVWLGLVVGFGFAVARSQTLFYVLWRLVPGFRYQRISERALALVGAAGPVLVAAGAQGVWQFVGSWRRAGRLVAVGVYAWLVVGMWRVTPPTPPMYSPEAERANNHAMRWLAANADGSRVHVWESPDRHWGSDNVTAPLGLEVITSYVSTEHHDFLPSDFDPPGFHTFIGDSQEEPAKFWGVLNVRYVLSTTARDEPGFHLVTRVQPCPISVCQPGKSAGPYVYENERWMAHVWRVERAIAVIGEERAAFEAALDIMHLPAFQADRVVVLQVPTRDAGQTADVRVGANLETPQAPRWGSPVARRAVEALLAEAHAPADDTAPAWRRRGPNRMEIDAPRARGWVVISEKLPLYGGWRARLAGADLPFVRADGVLGAFRAPEGGRIELVYRPRGFRVGMGAFATLLVALGLAAWSTHRRE